MLAVPYAVAKMELYGQALRYYRDSITILNNEKYQLEKSISAIREGELLKHIVENAESTGYGWLQQLDIATDSPALRYQIALLASYDFQEGIKNYRDLQFISRNLGGWEENIAAYDDMLAARETRYRSNLPAVEQVLNNDTLETMNQRYAALADSIASIEKNENSAGFSNVAETRQLHVLADIDRQLASMPDTPEISEMRNKRKLLHGVLLWNTDSEYKQRLWQKKQQLAELATLIQKTDAAIAQLKQSDLEAPVGFSGFEKQIAIQKRTIKTLQARTATASRTQELLLEQIAINELRAQQDRIDTYVIQARFALAQTYDKSLNKDPDLDGTAQ